MMDRRDQSICSVCDKCYWDSDGHTHEQCQQQLRLHAGSLHSDTARFLTRIVKFQSRFDVAPDVPMPLLNLAIRAALEAQGSIRPDGEWHATGCIDTIRPPCAAHCQIARLAMGMVKKAQEVPDTRKGDHELLHEKHQG